MRKLTYISCSVHLLFWKNVTTQMFGVVLLESVVRGVSNGYSPVLEHVIGDILTALVELENH